MSTRERSAFRYFASLTDRVYLPTSPRSEIPVIPHHIGPGYGDLRFDVQAGPQDLTPSQQERAYVDQLLLDQGFELIEE